LDAEDVLKHIYEGSIVGAATGTPGIFNLNIYQNIRPGLDAIQPDYALKLGLKVTGHTVYFRDLYVLLRWETEDETEIRVDMDDGNYEVVVCSWFPELGIREIINRLIFILPRRMNYRNCIMKGFQLSYRN